MEYKTYSHWYGEHAINHATLKPINEIISETKFSFVNGSSKKFRQEILAKLKKHGWSESVRLVPNSQITVTAMYNDIALCLQTGNMSRFYADLLKLQYLFINDKACAAVYILPTKIRAKDIGSNVAHFERFVDELELFKHIYTVPTLVIGLD